jgi:hypothetical protein
MNENDQERYFWRTGEKWGADERSVRELRGPQAKLTPFVLIVAAVSFLLSTVMLLVWNHPAR